MAKPDIIAKLKRRMTRLPITDEDGVVYVLTEVRKIFEHERSLHQQFPTLDFYLNWGLHIELERNRAAKDFLNAVMPILTVNGSHNEAEQQALNSLFTLGSFRNELGRFFATHGISDAVCTDADNWKKFLDAYSHLVEDAQLIMKNTSLPAGPLNLAVSSVTVSALRGTLSDSAPFPMVWRIEYVDGRKGTLTLSSYGLLGATLDLGA